MGIFVRRRSNNALVKYQISLKWWFFGDKNYIGRDMDIVERCIKKGYLRYGGKYTFTRYNRIYASEVESKDKELKQNLLSLNQKQYNSTQAEINEKKKERDRLKRECGL